jgi:hypothetical protein
MRGARRDDADPNPVDPNYQDLLADLPEEIRKQIDDAFANAPPEQLEDILYEIAAAHFGGLTKEQLLAIDLEKYDKLRTYPADDGTDWQLMRDRVMFLQVAVRSGIPWPQVATRTIPYFGSILKPPFEPVCEQLEPSAYQPPVYDQSRHTPASWAREADDGWHRHRDELLKLIREEFDQLIASGQLKLFERTRLSKEATNNEPIIDERLAMEMAAKRFFLGIAWADFAKEYPPAGGYTGSPVGRAKQKEKRANQIRMRVRSLLEHLGLPFTR